MYNNLMYGLKIKIEIGRASSRTKNKTLERERETTRQADTIRR
jgi:hypothetical protein